MALEMMTIDLTSEQPAAASKYPCLGATITAELIIGFWFGVEVMLAVGVADDLSHFIGEVTRGK